MLGWYTGDAGVYSIYSRSIYERSIGIYNSYSGYVMQTRKDYPPLYFLMVAFFYHLFGVSYVNGCLVTFIFGVLTVPATYLLATSTYGKREGLISAFIISILPWHIVFSGVILIDPVVAFFTTISVVVFLKTLKTEKWTHFVTLGIVMGLAYLTKTYAVILFPIFGVYFVVHHFYLRDEGKTISSSFKDNLFKFLVASVISFMLLATWFLNLGIEAITTHEALVKQLVPSRHGTFSPLFSIEFLAMELKFIIIFFFLGIVKVFFDKDKKGLLLFTLIAIPFAGYTFLAVVLKNLHAVWNFPRYVIMTIPPMCILITKGFDQFHDFIYQMYLYSPRSIKTLIKNIRRHWIFAPRGNRLYLLVYTVFLFSNLFLATRYYRLLIIGQVYFNGTQHIGDRQMVIEMACKYAENNLPENSIIVAGNADIYWLLEFYLIPMMEVRSQDDISSLAKSSEVTRFYYISYFSSPPDLSYPLKTTLLFTAHDADHPTMNSYLFEFSK